MAVDDSTDPPQNTSTALIEPQHVYGAEAIDPDVQRFQQLAALGEMADRERRAKAKETHDAACLQMNTQIMAFQEAIIGHLERERVLADWKRQSQDFDYRVKRNERRARNQMLLVFNADGTVDKTILDGHAELGIGLGWTEQAIVSASAYFNRLEYESASSFFMILGRGKKPENKNGAKVLTDVADHLLRSGGFKKEGLRLNNDLPKHGTGFLRYKMLKEHKFRRDEMGKFGDSAPELKPVFIKWPIQDVLLTNPEYPEAADQEGVFWISRGTDIHQIEDNEAQWDFDIDLQNGTLKLRRIAGEFQNLEPLRDLEKEAFAYQQLNFDASIISQSNRNQPISPFPTFDLVEFEGRLPMYAMVDQGKFTPEIATCFGFDLGLDPPDMNDPKSKAEWGKKLNKIKQWQVGYIRQTSSGTSSKTTNVLLTFHPCEYSNPRNSLYIQRYIQDGDNAYGRSVGDVGQILEDTAVCLLNSEIRTIHFNANPAFVYDTRSVIEKTLEEINRLLQPNQPIAMMPGVAPDPSKVISPIQLPVSDMVDHAILGLKSQFEANTLVSSVVKTGTDPDSVTDTLGELEIQKSSSQNKLDDVVIRNSNEKNRLIRDMLEDAYESLGPVGFSNLATQVSGQNATDIKRMIPSVEGFWREYDIDHPLSFGINKAVQVQQMALLFQTFVGAYDVGKMGEIAAGLVVPHPEEFTAKGFDILEPDEEEYQLANGNWVEPSPAMPVEMQVQHIFAHEDMLRQLQAAIQQRAGGSPDEDVTFQGQDPTNRVIIPAKNMPVFENLLVQHLQRHKRILQVMSMLNPAMFQPQVPQIGPPGANANGGGNGAGKPSPHDSPNAIAKDAHDTARQANQTQVSAIPQNGAQRVDA